MATRGRVRITDKDRGYNRLRRTAKKMARSRAALTVGIHAEEGSHGDAGALTVAQVGAFQEFGTATIPSRSFLRAWFDENRTGNLKFLAKLDRLVLKGKTTRRQAFDLFGVRAAAGVQARIARGIPPALAASTVARKGSTTPLIDTGQLRAAITHRVNL